MKDATRIEASRDFALFWLAYRNQSSGPLEKLLYPSILSQIGELDEKTVLDAGCGDGSFLNLISTAKDGTRLIGCDINATLLETARNRLLKGTEFIEVDVANGLEMISDSSIDLIVSSCLLIHLNDEDVEIALREFCRILKRTGRMIIAVIHPDWAQRMYDVNHVSEDVITTRKSANGVQWREWYRDDEFYDLLFRQQHLRLSVAETIDIVIPSNIKLGKRYEMEAGHPIFKLYRIMPI